MTRKDAFAVEARMLALGLCSVVTEKLPKRLRASEWQVSGRTPLEATPVKIRNLVEFCDALRLLEDEAYRRGQQEKAAKEEKRDRAEARKFVMFGTLGR